ncbi:hypothetical protein B0H63DRAFT_527253 [Podospora didyma]|uniref:Uncharacterized protein n=1 Tax=Podospora didyma TaxID=330526 RepID=A0AAE0K947_9PEZI|nr:hypothetical protein B0H63DRAFT_527253 [Podospora didyma]
MDQDSISSDKSASVISNDGLITPEDLDPHGLSDIRLRLGTRLVFATGSTIHGSSHVLRLRLKPSLIAGAVTSSHFILRNHLQTQPLRLPNPEQPLPANVQNLVDSITRLEAGRSLQPREAGTDGSALVHFPLQPDEWAILLSLLQRPGGEHLRYFEQSRLRYDFFADQHLFVIRMPGPKHEYMKGQIVGCIWDRPALLASLREPAITGPSTGLASPIQTGPCQISGREFAALIKPRGSLRLPFRNAKQLVKLANKYLLDTPGLRIQLVVTLAVSYPTCDETEKPEIFVERIKYLFRSNGDRAPTEVNTVSIKLREFTTPNIAPNAEHLQDEIVNYLDDINTWFDEAANKIRAASFSTDSNTTTRWESFCRRA